MRANNDIFTRVEASVLVRRALALPDVRQAYLDALVAAADSSNEGQEGGDACTGWLGARNGPAYGPGARARANDDTNKPFSTAQFEAAVDGLRSSHASAPEFVQLLGGQRVAHARCLQLAIRSGIRAATARTRSGVGRAIRDAVRVKNASRRRTAVASRHEQPQLAAQYQARGREGQAADERHPAVDHRDLAVGRAPVETRCQMCSTRTPSRAFAARSRRTRGSSSLWSMIRDPAAARSASIARTAAPAHSGPTTRRELLAAAAAAARRARSASKSRHASAPPPDRGHHARSRRSRESTCA